VVTRARYFIGDVAYWMRTHPVPALLVVLLIAAAAAGAALGIGALADDEDRRSLAPAPQVVVRTEEPPESASDLGFPAFATSNTTRVAAAEPIATAAGVALATSPAADGVEGPAAVSLVPADDWASGIAAASLISEPVGATTLLTDGEDISDLTADALELLAPGGSAATDNRQAFAIGSAPEPEGLRTLHVEGANPAATAAEVAFLRERLTEEDPEHLLIANSDEPAFAMPAAAWAARSGDPVLFAQRDSIPAATIEAIERYEDVPVYLLGPQSVISDKAETQIKEATKAAVKRAGSASDPVANAVEFARFVDGTFGWNINDPGHGFVIANAERPADAGAAAGLSGSGTWGPLLVTDDPALPPAELESYLLDLKPGYVDDPTRAVYNHIWIVGDEEAISVPFQVELDELAEVAPIRSGSGDSLISPGQGEPEDEQESRG